MLGIFASSGGHGRPLRITVDLKFARSESYKGHEKRKCSTDSTSVRHEQIGESDLLILARKELRKQ